ncbi:hypothetical protein [Streptomyces mirabilis]|uniref:hypothetical protein n=1 Tax=Streptomyces mirabilis TaxID=68239 RepID=UPI0033EC869D
MTTCQLDVKALYEQLDQQRRARGISWRQLADEVDCAASIFTRMKHGVGAPTAHLLLSLLVWLGQKEAVASLLRTSDSARPT